jgi:hypothetical protein
MNSTKENKMKYQVIGKLDEQKYKSCEGLEPKLWDMLKDKVYVLNTWKTLELAEWSANSHRDYKFSNLDLNSIKIIEVA